MKRHLALLLTAGLVAGSFSDAGAFCGFYVAKADTKLFNRASSVAIVRHGDRTVLTMSNDYQGEPSEFAMVIPVPTFITRDQIHVGDRAVLDHLDAYSSPRLVEYFDESPCLRQVRKSLAFPRAVADGVEEAAVERARSLGVAIEAQYSVGEYDILILGAAESTGLETWLRENDYRVPDGASRILASYIKQGNRFFVAKVDLEEHDRLGFSHLRPLQIAFESPKFMLPIRLGTLNADGPQELFAYLITRKGRVETTNYRTVRLPTGMDLPLFVKDDFADFYRAMFDRQVDREGMGVVFLEYAWNMTWCDPCAADPLSRDELESLGVFWLAESQGPPEVFITRLHARYDADSFPEDLVFQETGDNGNFQGRYVLRHPWEGDESCSGAEAYRASLPARFEREAQALATLTGWDVGGIRGRMDRSGQSFAPVPPRPWWKRIWGN